MVNRPLYIMISKMIKLGTGISGGETGKRMGVMTYDRKVDDKYET